MRNKTPKAVLFSCYVYLRKTREKASCGSFWTNCQFQGYIFHRIYIFIKMLEMCLRDEINSRNVWGYWWDMKGNNVFPLQYLDHPIAAFYHQSLITEGTSHTLRKEGAGPPMGALLVAGVLQRPTLVGFVFQKLQILMHLLKREVALAQEAHRPAGWRWGIWSAGLKHIWHPGTPVGKTAHRYTDSILTLHQRKA